VEKHNQKLSHLASLGVKIRDSTSELAHKNDSFVQNFNDVENNTLYNKSTLERSGGMGSPLMSSTAGKKTYIF
jgi:hypothetical protein